MTDNKVDTEEMDAEFVKEQIEYTKSVYTELCDWFSDFSTRVTVTVRYVVCGIFATAWLFLLKSGYSGFPILVISLLLAFVYMLLDIVRYYLIAKKIRNLYKRMDEVIETIDWDLLIEERNNVKSQFRRMHDKSWKCLNFQLIMFCFMVAIMGVFLVINLVEC